MARGGAKEHQGACRRSIKEHILRLERISEKGVNPEKKSAFQKSFAARTYILECSRYALQAYIDFRPLRNNLSQFTLK
jgi:hypothetical protein